jgi:phage terminase large subunit GpA-like protein
MRPRRVLLLDEIDRFAASAGAEGDPIALARARTKTFGARRKIIQTSTPTVKGKSRIAKLYFDDSDQRQYYVPCPDCGEFQTLRWANLIFDPAREGADAEYLCDFCGVLLPHAAKPEMLARGEWRAARQFAGVAGFWLNELYSPWVSWREMAAAFLRAKDDPQQLQAFVNTSLAELWEAEEDQAGRQVAAGDVAALREDYPPDVEAPDGVLVLTAGVDVQDDRLEIEVVGWGRDEESWSVDYRILYGSPAEPEVWRELLSVLSGEYRHADGAPIKIRAAGIDTGGHHTQDVYRFVQANAGRGVFALKGASVPAAQLVGGPSRPHGKIRVKLFTVGVDTAKEQLMARLRLIEPGPGYCHFPAWYDEEFFAQLTAEKLVDRYEKGRRIRKWVKTRARNEALDCRIYAAATLAILYPRPRWPQLAEGRAGLARQQEPSAGVAGQRPAAASFVPQRGGSGFLGGGRGNFLGGLR